MRGVNTRGSPRETFRAWVVTEEGKAVEAEWQVEESAREDCEAAKEVQGSSRDFVEAGPSSGVRRQVDR